MSGANAHPTSLALARAEAPTQTPEATVPKVRLRWPDAARGLSILGVVLLHVSLAVPGGMDTTVAGINSFLDPIRMPLFFMVSGFFSAKVLQLNFSQLFFGRLWFFLVPYLVWGPIELSLKMFEWSIVFGTEPLTFDEYTERFLVARSVYWFLYALIVFNMVAWLTRKLPSWAIILVGLSPLLLMSLDEEYAFVGKAIMYLPAFLIGVHLKPLIAQFAEKATTLRNLTRATLFFAAAYLLSFAWAVYNALYEVSVPWYLPGMGEAGFRQLRLIVNMIVHIGMLPMAIVLAVCLSRTPYVSTLLSFLGRHTLAIYLGHALGLVAFYHLPTVFLEIGFGAEENNPLLSTGAGMLLAFLAAILGSLAIHLLSKVPVLGWSVKPPRISFSRIPGLGQGARASAGSKQS